MSQTCLQLSMINGSKASMVTTQGDIVVPKFLARNGPSGWYSHFCMSLAVDHVIVQLPWLSLTTPVIHDHQTKYMLTSL